MLGRDLGAQRHDILQEDTKQRHEAVPEGVPRRSSFESEEVQREGGNVIRDMGKTASRGQDL